MNPDIWTIGAVLIAFVSLWAIYHFRAYVRAVDRGEVD